MIGDIAFKKGTYEKHYLFCSCYYYERWASLIFCKNIRNGNVLLYIFYRENKKE